MYTIFSQFTHCESKCRTITVCFNSFFLIYHKCIYGERIEYIAALWCASKVESITVTEKMQNQENINIQHRILPYAKLGKAYGRTVSR